MNHSRNERGTGKGLGTWRMGCSSSASALVGRGGVPRFWWSDGDGSYGWRRGRGFQKQQADQ
jgi:hypothetical protein